MLSNFKFKFQWYVNRFLSEIFLCKVLLKKGFKKNAVPHQLPKKLIISLTSHKPRFATLFPTILSLLQQNIAAETIVLWVSSDDYSQVPKSIMNLKGTVNDSGTIFEVMETVDIGPYTKIIPTLESFDEQFVVTVDDDIYYPDWWLQHLLEEYEGNDKEIICYLAHQITFDKTTNAINPYNEWETNKSKNVDPYLGFPLGVGGVLYPPNCLNDLVTNHDLFLKESPMADDIWLFWMARINGSVTKKTQRNFNAICWPKSEKVGLLTSNVENNGNDKKIQNMTRKFGWPPNS